MNMKKKAFIGVYGCQMNISDAERMEGQLVTIGYERTEDMEEAKDFCKKVDSACVYINASTRFTDGEEFGFGAEIGISTQKLHARGPMGLKELTSYKYLIYGDGQIR